MSIFLRSFALAAGVVAASVVEEAGSIPAKHDFKSASKPISDVGSITASAQRDIKLSTLADPASDLQPLMVAAQSAMLDKGAKLMGKMAPKRRHAERSHTRRAEDASLLQSDQWLGSWLEGFKVAPDADQDTWQVYWNRIPAEWLLQTTLYDVPLKKSFSFAQHSNFGLDAGTVFRKMRPMRPGTLSRPASTQPFTYDYVVLLNRAFGGDLHDGLYVLRLKEDQVDLRDHAFRALVGLNSQSGFEKFYPTHEVPSRTPLDGVGWTHTIVRDDATRIREFPELPTHPRFLK